MSKSDSLSLSHLAMRYTYGQAVKVAEELKTDALHRPDTAPAWLNAEQQRLKFRLQAVVERKAKAKAKRERREAEGKPCGAGCTPRAAIKLNTPEPVERKWRTQMVDRPAPHGAKPYDRYADGSVKLRTYTGG